MTRSVLLVVVAFLAGYGCRLWVHDCPAPLVSDRSGPAPTASGEKPSLAPEPAPTVAASSGHAEELARLQDALRLAESDRDALRRSLLERDAVISGHRQDRAKTLEEVLTAIDQLKGNGLKAFLSPGATNELVADLKKLGTPGLDAVLEMLGSSDEQARFLAAKLLEDMADPRSIDLLTKAAMEDSSEMVANMASHALALMDNPSVLPSLRELVETSKKEGVRVNSLFGLCKHGDSQGIADGLKFLQDDANSRSMQGAFGAGLLILSDPRLMALADATLARFETNGDIGGMAVSYYKNVHTPEARIRLLNLSENGQAPASVREAALVALGNW